MTLDPNDPKLTAYALGELNGADRAAVEKDLDDSPALREAVDEIRRTADLVTEHLQSEPAPALTADQRQAVLREPDGGPTVTPTGKPRSRRRLLFSLAAAACVLLATGAVLWSLPWIWGGRSTGDRVALVADRSSSAEFLEVGSGEFSSEHTEMPLELPVYAPDDLTAPEDLIVEGEALSGRIKGSRLRAAYGGAMRSAAPSQQPSAGPSSGEGSTEPNVRFSDGSPLTYPDAQVWQRLTERRNAGGQQSAAVGLQAPGVFSADLDLADKEEGRERAHRGEEPAGEGYGDRSGGEGGRTGSVQVEIVADKDEVLVIRGDKRDVQKVMEMIAETESLTASPRDAQKVAEIIEHPERTTETAKPADADSDKRDRKPAETATWRRAQATPNASRLMIGDERDLPLEGMQANVTIDGFRARVLLDYYFYNDGDQQYEGTFKLRLPSDASLYFFAFGESAYRYRPQEKKDVRGAFLTVSRSKPADGLPDEILKLRADSWNAPKVARVVPREKAAFAYRQTVRRRVDPALVEWSGAGVFSARVFPLAPHKLHRIVVGYDVDLVPVEGDLEYRLDLPEVAECTVDLNLSSWAGGSARITPDRRPFMSNGRACYHFADFTGRALRVRLENPGTVLLTGADAETGNYFATRFRPELPKDAEGTCASTAVFLLDTSLSSNPDKFNVWLKLLRAVLDDNRDAIDEFAVLFFNVEAHWWQEEFVKNTPENVAKLLDYAHTLVLEGATDLGQAFREAASPSWLDASGETARWDVFLLSDGALNWGETNVHVLAESLAGNASHAGALFAFQTGMAGTESRVLDHLARETGGAVFAVTAEAQVDEVARAHRQRPWQLVDVRLEGGSDLLVAGRPKTIFPGQQLLLVGRGEPADDAAVVLKLRRGEKNKTVRVKPDRVIASELASRLYGQVAVGQLESLDEASEDVAVSYARHFRVTGQTCSLVMLESEADYQRFEIKPEDDPFVVTSSSVAQVVAGALDAAAERLADPKAAFQAWLGRLEKMPGARFSVSPALRLAVESLPRQAFEVRTRPLRAKNRTWAGMPSELKENLSVGQVDYERIAAEAERRLQEYGEADALRIYSSLVEHSPGDLALVRDVAYSALAWGLPDQAYHLFRRVAIARPYEPQVYLAAARSLAQAGHADLALFYYEVALGGRWDDRFRDFHRIASVDYLHLLRRIADGRQKAKLVEFASARLKSLGEQVPFDAADLVVTILWNTDGTDVDLHVTEPTGEVCNYQNRQTKIGGQLTPDCTDGFGPEMYTLTKARDGKYKVDVNYFASDRNRAGTRTKVFATIYEGWGTEQERAVQKALVLEKNKQTHHVATVGVEK